LFGAPIEKNNLNPFLIRSYSPFVIFIFNCDIYDIIFVIICVSNMW